MTITPGVPVDAALPMNRPPLMLMSFVSERASLRTLPAISSLSMKMKVLPHRVCGFFVTKSVFCCAASCPPSPIHVCLRRREAGR